MKGESYEPNRSDTAFMTEMTKYRDWVDLDGKVEVESEPVSQTVEGFIACQHSRDTFAPAKLGARMEQFDAHLRTILAEHAHEGVLTYTVRTRLEWGSIK